MPRPRSRCWAIYFPRSQRGRVLSYWSSGTLIGAAIGFTLGGLIADAFGWRWAFYIVGIPGLIAAFLAWRITEPARGTFDAEEELAIEGEVTEEEEDIPIRSSIGTDFWGSVTKLLKVRTYWVLLAALVFSFFTIGGTSFWLPTYVIHAFKLTTGQAGLISGGVLVSSGLVGNIAWWLAGRHRTAPLAPGTTACGNARFPTRRSTCAGRALYSQPAHVHLRVHSGWHRAQLLHWPS